MQSAALANAVIYVSSFLARSFSNTCNRRIASTTSSRVFSECVGTCLDKADWRAAHSICTAFSGGSNSLSITHARANVSGASRPCVASALRGPDADAAARRMKRKLVSPRVEDSNFSQVSEQWKVPRSYTSLHQRTEGAKSHIGRLSMASVRREIMTKARIDDAWSAIRDVGALHTRLVPGFVTDTKLEGAVRIVTFGNGMVVREPIVTVDDQEKRVVWSAEGGITKHYNASVQISANDDGSSKVVWIADFLPDSAATAISSAIDTGMAVMKKTLDRMA